MILYLKGQAPWGFLDPMSIAAKLWGFSPVPGTSIEEIEIHWIKWYILKSNNLILRLYLRKLIFDHSIPISQESAPRGEEWALTLAPFTPTKSPNFVLKSSPFGFKWNCCSPFPLVSKVFTCTSIPLTISSTLPAIVLDSIDNPFQVLKYLNIFFTFFISTIEVPLMMY